MRIQVNVKANSKKGPLLVNESDNSYVAYIRQAAHDGKANTELVELLSDYFKCPKTNIEITKGQTSRQKTITIADRA